MKTFISACVIVAATSFTLVTPVEAVEVCNYTVTSSFGFRCPFFTGRTACLSVSAAIGRCDLPVDCFGGNSSFVCRLTLRPKSGPGPVCAAASSRLPGLRCFANRRPVVTRTPIVTRTPTVTPVPTGGTPTPTGVDFVGFVKQLLASTDPEPVEINDIRFENRFIDNENAFCDVLPPMACQ